MPACCSPASLLPPSYSVSGYANAIALASTAQRCESDEIWQHASIWMTSCDG